MFRIVFSLSLLRDIPPLGFLRIFFFFSFHNLAIRVEDVMSMLENMRLTPEEEEIIEILDEKKGWKVVHLV